MRLVVVALLLVIGQGWQLLAQEEWHETEAAQRFALGVTATLASADHLPRRYDQIVYSTGPDAAHPGIRWHGFLQTQTPGTYRLAVLVGGEVQVKLAGKQVLQVRSTTPVWKESEPLELDYDRHELQVSLQPFAGVCQITLYWSGPGFQYEPIPAKQLYYDRTETLSASHVAGRNLTRALRCDACHQIEGLPPRPLRSPALNKLDGVLRHDWLVSYLTAPTDVTETGVTRTTDVSTVFGKLHGSMSAEDARDVSAYLRSQSPRATQDRATQDRADMVGNADDGRQLFLTLGCLACHQWRHLGTRHEFAGGDLTRIAQKRPSTFFSRWLAQPDRINADHRMPIFDLSVAERHHLAAFLATLGEPAASKLAELPAGNAQRGAGIVAHLRCAVCHRLTVDENDNQPSQQRTPLGAASKWSQSCVRASSSDHPGYGIDDESMLTAIRDFVSDEVETMVNELLPTELLLRENQCLACHARSGTAGLLPMAQKVIEEHVELAAKLPAMLPPSLNSVGGKLKEEALLQAITRRGKPQRPWLAVRMPRFPLADHQVRRIAEYFMIHDRVPDGARSATTLHRDVSSHVAERLVTADGFGCTSCHAIGKMKPRIAPLGTQGANLSMLGRRIRRTWFDRWVRNPARIVPKMEMPSVQVPVPGVLDEDLDQQLAAVWNVLNRPNFEPPDPHPVRVVRRSGMGRSGERAVVLTDVLQHQEQTLIKPFLIGLPNRHNVLMDLAAGRLAGWWTGDTARQRTRGKTWYWESAGDDVMTMDRLPDLWLVRGGMMLQPQRSGQFVTEPDAWMHVDGGVQIEYRLRFQPSLATVIRVRQRITPLDVSATRGAGWRREIHVSGLADGDAIMLRWVGRRELVHLISPSGNRSHENRVTVPAHGARGNARLVLEYRHEDKPALAPEIGPTPANEPSRVLDVVPGFRVTRLGLTRKLMPTALGWTPDGRLIITSLKGRVWLAEDTNDDQLEDQLRPISDELAAPYGVHATADYIDVVNKYGLLRLRDTNGDDISDRTTLVATGWGHTDDYHDWAVGLPIDEEGNYYVAIPCQQDNRTEAAARLRGSVVQLAPRKPNAADPRLFELRELSRGHRFPMGIARNRIGQLFVSDNQGNYNPFNELNQIVAGAHYGFINKLDATSNSKGPPLTPPAIDIPHPWTRSVNGICFLETPPALRESGKQVFGPFEGHLVGCEYDTRRLIRMSLDDVDGGVQGAAYPFSEYHAESGDTLLGPLVCAVSPDGSLYIGNIRDSGWGGANNTGTVVRAVPDLESLPAGIAEVRAVKGGFHIDFTRSVSPERADRIENYTIDSYRRISTPAYGGDDVDRRRELIDRVSVASDRRSVRLELSNLRAGFVYEIRLKNLAADGKRFFPAEAFYTLRRMAH